MLQPSETELACCLALNAFSVFSIEFLGLIKETRLIFTVNVRREGRGRLRLALRINMAFLHDLPLIYNRSEERERELYQVIHRSNR